jgi:hypothetical protein
VYVSFAGVEWPILGRMTDASDEALLEDVPGAVCSVRMVTPWAMHALYVIVSAHIGYTGMAGEIAI